MIAGLELGDQVTVIIGNDTQIAGRVAGIRSGPGNAEITLIGTNVELVTVERVTVMRITEPSS